ncbi:MAG: thiamine pyrophosphate-requiring protein [Hyphomonadaceae bacterium]|jgi:acetolactate synthase-1/2/3 large subunit|nr:thiamine pyrophosphate-requiring protein [Hyphomonadaceae bacterium]
MPVRKADSVATAYLALLAERGVDYLFGNAGTDFAPIVEAYAEAEQKGTRVPQPILATHENLAVTMAHGYAMVSRRIPAVMVHVSVGTANMVCAAMNAARENVAILLTAGRSPITEAGQLGSRDGYIHWAQEMYDQAGMIRELVKWDYELRNGEQLETVVDRALSIAATEPRGPVYLSLPREVIAAPMSAGHRTSTRLRAAAPAAPDGEAIALASRMLAKAKKPLILTASAGRDPAAFAALAQFADRFAVPVVQFHPRYLSLPSSHPMNLGYDPTALVADTDLILAMDVDVPWIPAHVAPPKACQVIQCGFDPLFRHIPIRGFACDLGITGATAAILQMLTDALVEQIDDAAVAERRARITKTSASLAAEWKRTCERVATRSPIHPAWVSHCLQEAKDPHAIVVNEYTLRLAHCGFQFADSYFGSSSASGLGWGPGAALGAKLAAPDRQVVAVVGDGAYLFSNPVAVHHAAALHDLPVLFIVMNNAMWNAVRHFTTAMYPSGRASKRNDAPFTRLDRLPAFEQICAAAGGYGERVDDPAALPAALERAIAVVTREKRQALLNVICGVD